MAACPQCGSRSIRLVINPLTWFAHLITESRASKCPRCGWRGWKHRKEWLHIPAAGILRGGTGHSGDIVARRRKGAPGAGPAQDKKAGNGPIHDRAFETVVTDGAAAPDLDAIDLKLAESRENRAAERANRPGRPGGHHR
jgi:DNA-directed RNA polymerase subunit RPC12/RpoP